MKKAFGMLLVQLCVLIAGVGVASARPADNIHFLVTGRVEDPSATIVANGVITGIGTLTAESVDYRPGDNTYHETDLVVIGGGTLTMSVDGAFDVWPFALDPRTCTQHGTLTGTWTVTAGGGEFGGATGDGSFSGRFFTYAAHGLAGCDDTTIKGFVVGPMTGHLTLPRPARPAAHWPAPRSATG